MDDSDDEETLELIIEEFFAEMEEDFIRKQQPVPPQFLKKNGEARKRNRSDESFHKGKKAEKAPNPWLSCNWLRNLVLPETEDPTTAKGKDFERSFRMSVFTFRKLVARCRATGENEFNYKEFNVVDGSYNIPLELKILCAIRILATGCKFREAAEMSQYMSEGTAGSFFGVFCKLFVQHFKSEFIRPLEGEELHDQLRRSAKIGLPGMVASFDATFIPWETCPHQLSNLHQGPKGHGLLYQVAATHEGWVVAVEGGYPATMSDKITIKYSKFYDLLTSGKLYKDISYKIRTGPLETDFVECSDCWIIVDGGYINSQYLICGYQSSPDRVKYKFTDWVASVRKDIECFFGRLKQRFRFFRNPITLPDKEDIDNAMVTACIIQNMILKEKGIGIWQESVNWKNLNPLLKEGEEEEKEDENGGYLQGGVEYHDPAGAFEPIHIADLYPNLTTQLSRFQKMQDLLAHHLNIMYNEGKLYWPRTRSEIEKRFDDLPRQHYPLANDLANDLG